MLNNVDRTLIVLIVQSLSNVWRMSATPRVNVGISGKIIGSFYADCA